MQQTPVTKPESKNAFDFKRTLRVIRDFSSGMAAFNTTGSSVEQAEHSVDVTSFLQSDLTPFIYKENHVWVCEFLQKLKVSMKWNQFISLNSIRIFREPARQKRI